MTDDRDDLLESLQDEVAALRSEQERNRVGDESARRIIDDLVATVRSLTRQGADAAVILARVEQDATRAVRELDGDPPLSVIRDRVVRMSDKQPNDSGWHDNVERGWGATIRESPIRVLTAGFVGVLLLLAFSVALAVCNSPDPIGTLTRQSVEAQQQGADAQGRAADALEDMAEPPLDFAPDSTGYPD